MLNLFRKQFTFSSDEGMKCVDESLSIPDRIKFLLRSDDFIQRQACVKQLVDSAFGIGFEGTLRYIIPVWQELVNDMDAQVRSLTLSCSSDLAGCLIQSDCDHGYENHISCIYFLGTRL